MDAINYFSDRITTGNIVTFTVGFAWEMQGNVFRNQSRNATQLSDVPLALTDVVERYEYQNERLLEEFTNYEAELQRINQNDANLLGAQQELDAQRD